MRRSLPLAAVALLAALPWLLARHQLSILTELLVFGIFAMSLDLLMGYTGMVSFGHAAYFGLGASPARCWPPRWPCRSDISAPARAASTSAC
jgi:ABC-type branched-subunit amino acid transport system permease subunit